MSFTLTTLTSSIQEWTQNDEATFVAEIPFFIKNAEERIFKVVDLDYFRKNVTGDMTSGNKFLQKPSDYLSTFSLSYVNSSSQNVFLSQKDVNYLQEFTPNPSTTGSPRFYASFDVDNFIVAPTPDSSYSVELHYYYTPDALLYASLVEAYTFMKGEPDLIQLYTARFTEAMSRLKIYGESQENTDAYREGLVKVPKQ